MIATDSANTTSPARRATLRKSGVLLPLLIGFGALATFFVSSGIVAYSKSRTLREDSRLVVHTHDVILALKDILSLMTDAETGQRGYLLTGDNQYLLPYTTALTRIDTRVGELEALISDNPTQVMRIPGLKAHVDQKRALLAEAIELRRTRSLEAAQALVLSGRGKVAMDAIREDISVMVETEEMLRRQRLTEADSAFKTSLWTGLSVSGLGLMLGAAVTLMLGRSQLATQRQKWLQVGHLQLAEHLAGDQKTPELSENALKFLCDYVGAQAGVLYIEDGIGLQRMATYAVPAASAVPERIKRGDGLVGQAAKDGKVTLVKDVPAGYLTIGSALGQRLPSQLVIVPAAVEGDVNAVLELGFFQGVSDDVVELMTRVSETIGVAVRSARYRARVQDLLEETQRQAEEVQAQSEELRVSNEELEEQSRALKESQTGLEEQQSALELTNAQLGQQTRFLERQKEELRQAKTALEKQAQVLEQASRYKSEFLANMSHELRTPLNSSLILAKLLADNKGGNLTAEQVKYAQTIQSAGNDLLTLINEVLDLSKVEAGRIEIRPELVNLALLVDTLRALFEPTATQKGVTLRMQILPGVPENLVTDALRLEQVLKNLLSNALKFTERGEVALEISRMADGRIACAVRDTGIGIATDQHQVIFEPFRQGDGTTSRKFGGTGLGLSISRELVRLLGGEIQVVSEVGRGSVFTLLLPEIYVGALPAPAPAAEAAEKSADARSVAEPASASAKPASAPAAESPAETVPSIPDDRAHLHGGGRVILIVEDDSTFAQIVADLAHEMSFQCLAAATAEDALTLARRHVPSAVVLDIGLPDNSGLLVLERLKQDSRTRHIPVHVVSGSDYTSEALSMGAFGYMLKPVKREELVQAFRKLESRLTQKPQKVLIVEDDDVQLDSLQRLLATGDVATVGAKTASECLEKLQHETFDCMVLDLTLSDASGFALLETLSASDRHSFPPVIVYTGRDLTSGEEQRLRKYSKSIIIKGAKSPERLLDEVTLFLHQVVSELPADKQSMLEKARGRDDRLEGRQILVVEDDVRNIFALTSLLEPHGVKVMIARNGREALEALDKSKSGAAPAVHLVLMDLMMPEMDGMTAIREIRRRAEWKRLPIIALTAKAMRNDREQSLEAGANDYLAKPLDVEKLLSLIRVWMPR